ncbi:hypothetical protein [Maricaulis salignorans]|uniref:Uncharacterized protein n=1 Tax=Maricaulis salignorans TaxID=144026 RepID=A0A1G9W322_9PROT|nr:hypothetical protein [Maricaulis salignorans]SDM78591.1 hypothetical protein SAMN04488568_12210 [Maricaulis salignorans]
MISLLSDLARALGLAVDAALLQRAAFTHLVEHPSIALAALVIPLIAGASEMLGKAYVLAAQQVGRWRIMASLIVTGLVYLLGVLVWSASAHVLLSLAGGLSVSETVLAGTIALAYAPRLLSVLTVAPYYGEFLDRALDAWTFVCVGWGFWVVIGGPLGLVIVSAAAGWMVSAAVRHYGGRLSEPLLRRLRLVTPGGGHD